MIHFFKFDRLVAGVACALFLSACSTAPVKPTPKLSLEEAMAEATDASKQGNKEQSLKMLDKATAEFPTDKEPWLQKAQIKFEGGQYGEAILDAQQSLARDPTDKVANSIVAISGLRLSTTALADLARQNNLSGSLRSESQELAKLLRESIGEAVLVPAIKPKPPVAAPVRPPVRKAPAAKAAAPSTGANPFGDLN